MRYNLTVYIGSRESTYLFALCRHFCLIANIVKYYGIDDSCYYITVKSTMTPPKHGLIYLYYKYIKLLSELGMSINNIMHYSSIYYSINKIIYDNKCKDSDNITSSRQGLVDTTTHFTRMVDDRKLLKYIKKTLLCNEETKPIFITTNDYNHFHDHLHDLFRIKQKLSDPIRQLIPPPDIVSYMSTREGLVDPIPPRRIVDAISYKNNWMFSLAGSTGKTATVAKIAVSLPKQYTD